MIMHSTTARRACILALAAVLLVPATASSAEKAIWGSINLPNGGSAFSTYADLGVDTFQMQLNWDTVATTKPANATDPNDPAYRWPEQIGTALVQGRTNGIRLALLVSGTPPWANGDRSRIWAPSNPQDFGDFLAAAAKRYSSVRRWMIWGEPNMAVRFQPQEADSGVSARAYAPMLDSAYVALKKVNRRNIVIGGMTWTGGDVKPARFLREMKLPNGKPPRLDWFGHNPYPYRHPRLRFKPQGDFRDMSDLDTFTREIDRAYKGVRKGPVPLWLSEFMIQSDRSSFAFATHVSREAQAAWLKSGFRIADKLGERVSGIGWFSFADQPPGPESANWGLVTSSGERKPAYEAFEEAPSERLAPGVRAARQAKRSTMAAGGIQVRLSLQEPGRYSIQLRRKGSIVAIRRVKSSKARTVRPRLRRSGLRSGRRYTIRIVSPRGSTIERTLRIR